MRYTVRMSFPTLDPSENPTCTIDEAAQILGVSRTVAYESARKGQLPTIKMGKRLLVPTAALRRLLQLDEAPSAPPVG